MRTNLRDQFDETQRKEFVPKIIARNTFRFTREGETVIRLHSTDIVTKHKDGSVTLNSAGWKTVTTKKRMNGALPAGYHLWQERDAWFVSKNGASWEESRASKVPYFDGIRVPQCFDKVSPKGAANEKRETKLRADIKKFVGKLDKLECLPIPSNGDCWYCMMKVSSPAKDTGKSLGEATGDNEHIRAHVKEGYLHGSLIINALKWAGYRDPGFIFAMDNADMAKGKRPNMVKRALKRYLYRQMGLVS